MKNRAFALAACAALAIPGLSLAATSDRHPGIYRFGAAPAEVCAAREREADRAAPPHLSNLTTLPPAYFILLSDTGRATPQRAAPPLGAALAPPVDGAACVTLIKIK